MWLQIGGVRAPSPVGELGNVEMTQALTLADTQWQAVGPDMLLTGALLCSAPYCPSQWLLIHLSSDKWVPVLRLAWMKIKQERSCILSKLSKAVELSSICGWLNRVSAVLGGSRFTGGKAEGWRAAVRHAGRRPSFQLCRRVYAPICCTEWRPPRQRPLQRRHPPPVAPLQRGQGMFLFVYSNYRENTCRGLPPLEPL